MDLALFDFDGTLTTCETLPAFVRFAVPTLRLRLGEVALAPWVIGYRAGWVSGTRVRSAIARVGFSGMPVERYEALGRAFARDVLPGVLRPQAMQRLAWHQNRGDRVAVVSGGWEVYLRHWCAQHGVELICSALEVRGKRLSGRFAGQQCVADEKARRVRAQFDLDAYASVYAYGDTAEDEALLALADVAFYQGHQRV